MRPKKDLDELVDDTLKLTGGTCPFGIVAQDQQEYDYIVARLKGKKWAKLVSVRIAKIPY